MSDAPAPRCPRCGGPHVEFVQCQLVKAVEFDAGGNVTRVEFMTPMDLRLAAGAHELGDGPEYPKLGSEN